MDYFILVVDDEEGIRALVRDSLEFISQRSNIHSAENGQKAIEKLDGLMKEGEGYKKGVVVTDMNMPEKTGFDVLDYVTVNYPSIPVILTSADEELSSTAIEKGAYAFVSKPFITMNPLLSVVEEALNSQS